MIVHLMDPTRRIVCWRCVWRFPTIENDSVPRVVVTCCCHSKRGNQIASVVVMTDDEQLNILNGPIVQPMMVTKGHVCSWWILWWSFFSIISHLFLFFPLSKCFFFPGKGLLFPLVTHTHILLLCLSGKSVPHTYTYKVVDWIFTRCCCRAWSYKPVK